MGGRTASSLKGGSVVVSPGSYWLVMLGPTLYDWHIKFK
jgi:hypothetical protein